MNKIPDIDEKYFVSLAREIVARAKDSHSCYNEGAQFAVEAIHFYFQQGYRFGNPIINRFKKELLEFKEKKVAMEKILNN